MNKTNLPLSRRKFLTLAGYSALAIPLSGQKIIGANDRIRMAVIGCGIRGKSHVTQFSKIAGVELVAICDPDTAQMASLVKRVSSEIDISKVEQVQDYRKILERKDIDVVSIASPNHWHTLHAIQALQAGKDVYLEKPVTHRFWEGHQLLAAKEKYGRIIAGGFQNRSDPGPREGIQYVQEGNLGKILSVHACCFKNRKSIGGPLDKPLVPPETIDYNLWLGPAEDLPILRPRLHYDWHWIWNTGDGDIGNQCPHEIDMLCWVLGDGSLPKVVKSFGGRFGWNDAGETPNMHTAWFEKKGVPCFVEVNNMSLTPERAVPGMRDQVRIGIVVRCEGGELRGGRGGMYAVGDDGTTRLMKFPGDGGGSHQKNFIDAVRSGDDSGLRSPLESAAISSAVAHLSNISVRSGAPANLTRIRNKIGDSGMLHTILDEQSAQLKDWGIDEPKFTLGKSVRVDTKTNTITSEGFESLIKPSSRNEFQIPELA